MSVNVSWYLEGRIIYIRYYGDVTIEDKRISAEKEFELLESGITPKVHVLLDITDQVSSPTQIGEIQKSLDKVLKHPSKGLTVAYGKKDFRMENFVNTIVTQSYPARYHTFVTRAEALSFLVYADPSLRSLIDIK